MKISFIGSSTGTDPSIGQSSIVGNRDGCSDHVWSITCVLFITEKKTML